MKSNLWHEAKHFMKADYVTKRSCLFFSSLVAAFLLTSCSHLHAGPAVSSDAVHGHGLLASTPSVTRTKDGLLVTGWVTRGAVYDGSLPMHVDVAVWEGGKRLVLAPTNFTPNPIPHRRRLAGSAKYTRDLKGDFAATVHVHVRMHAARLAECLREKRKAS